MRILVGSLIQESNTFSPLRADLAFFRSGCLCFDQESLDLLSGTRTELGGFIAAGQEVGAELVPTVAAWAASAGAMEGTAYRWLAEELLRRVRGAGAVDGVLLALHGAWVAEDEEDADGWILEQVRRIVGPDVPVVATLDLHANITARMVEAADALVGFRTYPHIDMFETGDRAARLLFTLLREGVRPAMYTCKVPLVVPPENAGTTAGHAAEVMASLVGLEGAADCLSASLFMVQPWLDVAEMGCTALLVTRGPSVAAREAVDAAGLRLWERRRAFEVPLVAPAEAVARALSAPDGPIVLVDSADSVSSGSTGDSTALLRALREAGPPRPALVTLVDPAAARAAAQADGAQVTLAVGGGLDSARHRPVTVSGVARRVPASRVTFSGGVGDGLSAELGAAAVLTAGELRILLMERPVPCYDPALYRVAGLEPAQAHVVVVKSPNNFRWTYREIMRDWIYVDAPGASTPRLAALPYRRVPRPLYPLDDWPWQPAPAADAGAAGHAPERGEGRA
jgi:microcystin degradation protein MlrC